MGVPRNAMILRGAPLKSGVMLGISPSSDPTFDVEMARATSSGVYTTLARLTNKGEGNPSLYTDLAPLDGQARSYKARAVKDGWTPGDYTAVVSAKPVLLPEISPNVTPLTGKGIGSNVFLSTAQKVQFGSAANQKYYRKTLRVGAGDCMADTSTGLYAFNGQGELYPNSTNNSVHTYFAPVGAPLGCIFVSMKARVYRGTTGGTVEVDFNQVNSTGAVVTTVVAISTAAGGYQSLTNNIGGSLPASTAYMYNLIVKLKSNNAARTNARFSWCDITYDVPFVQVGV